MHFVVCDFVCFYRSERAETYMECYISDADTFFPPIDPQVWEVEERSEMHHDEEAGFDFEFVQYVRRDR